jgi:predicted signal transduction protein with EAL and GGDEF domain
LRETDTIARLGGDEFAIVQIGARTQAGELSQRASAIELATWIMDVLRRPFTLDGFNTSVGVSIGIALAPEDGIEPSELLKKADLALYRTKAWGRDGFTFFDPDMMMEMQSRHRLAHDMRDALTRHEFELHYQPVVGVTTRTTIAAEALTRWLHPERGLLSPDQFIPLAEETGFIEELGAWILRKACSDAASWPAQVKLAVNLSPVQFRRGDLYDVVVSALADAALPPERLEIEITESVLLDRDPGASDLLRKFKDIGITIVLDDFGTGFSSLSYVTSFPVDKIKIDKSFTQGLAERQECAAVVASVVTLARALDLATTAEGVETEEQFTLLKAAGVTHAQGYLFGRPQPMSALTFGWPGQGTGASSAA